MFQDKLFVITAVIDCICKALKDCIVRNHVVPMIWMAHGKCLRKQPNFKQNERVIFPFQ